MSRHHSNFPTDSCGIVVVFIYSTWNTKNILKCSCTSKKIKSLQNILGIGQVGSCVLKRSEFLTLNFYNPIHSTQNVKKREIAEILEDI